MDTKKFDFTIEKTCLRGGCRRLKAAETLKNVKEIIHDRQIAEIYKYQMLLNKFSRGVFVRR